MQVRQVGGAGLPVKASNGGASVVSQGEVLGRSGPSVEATVLHE